MGWGGGGGGELRASDELDIEVTLTCGLVII